MFCLTASYSRIRFFRLPYLAYSRSFSSDCLEYSSRSLARSGSLSPTPAAFSARADASKRMISRSRPCRYFSLSRDFLYSLYSGYSYVEAFFSMNQESWTTAHVNAYKYFGGVTRIIQCDNLKTGVQKHGKDEVVLNKSYQELAEHYGTAILPARVRTPKDYRRKSVIGNLGLNIA